MILLSCLFAILAALLASVFILDSEAVRLFDLAF